MNKIKSFAATVGFLLFGIGALLYIGIESLLNVLYK